MTGNPTVYRLFDSHGRLVYVGKTVGSVSDRLRAHRHRNAWWPMVDPNRTEAQEYLTVLEMEYARREAIRDESPSMNIQKSYAIKIHPATSGSGRVASRTERLAQKYARNQLPDNRPDSDDTPPPALADREAGRFYRGDPLDLDTASEYGQQNSYPNPARVVMVDPKFLEVQYDTGTGIQTFEVHDPAHLTLVTPDAAR